ncbi:MAG: ion channel [Candidatus Thermoplasmatota archaeon]|nr:ion channel [Candidatus Thermoplasmatota archaeon]
MEELVKELLKIHEKDRDLSGLKVQQEVNKLREKYNRADCELKEDEQLIGLDWSSAILNNYFFKNVKLSKENKQAHFNKAQLRHANLEKAILINAIFECADLAFADLNRSNLKHSNIIVTNLNYAYLEGCNLIDADYEQAEYFEFAKFQKIDESDPASAVREYYNLERFFKEKNRPERVANFYFYRKRLMTKRHLLDWKSHKRDVKALFAFVINRTWEALCGYAERPWRVIRTMFLTIFICAIIYHFAWGGPVSKEGISSGSFLDSLYFSGVTFTTLGYGDLHPVSTNFGMKFLVVGEALIGAFLMALFLVVLSRRMIR